MSRYDAIKIALRPWKFSMACLPWRCGAAIGLWKGSGAPVQFVIEKADWAIRWVGEHVRDEVEKLTPGMVATTTDPSRAVSRVMHFGSQYMWLNWGRHLSPSNHFVTSFFHGKPEDGPDVARHIEEFLASVPKLSKVVTGAGIIERRLLSWGVPRDKLVRIPIGVDTQAFSPPTPEQRSAARARFEIPDGAVVIGSFQKDGIGWGDGMEPKRIKGPDVFLAAVTEMKAQGVPVTAFLTGPARGFVKQGLDRLGIPYIHTYVQDHVDLLACYHALDIYLVTSREEGGPMGLMEGMASGVPVVSTCVGMAPDIIEDGVTGALVESEDVHGIAQRALALLDSSELGDLRVRARAAVMVADWSVVGRDHWFKVYQPLLQQ